MFPIVMRFIVTNLQPLAEQTNRSVTPHPQNISILLDLVQNKNKY